MNILNIEHVSKVFGEKVVLDDGFLRGASGRIRLGSSGLMGPGSLRF
mgnify:FL=1